MSRSKYRRRLVSESADLGSRNFAKKILTNLKERQPTYKKHTVKSPMMSFRFSHHDAKARQLRRAGRHNRGASGARGKTPWTTPPRIHLNNPHGKYPTN